MRITAASLAIVMAIYPHLPIPATSHVPGTVLRSIVTGQQSSFGSSGATVNPTTGSGSVKDSATDTFGTSVVRPLESSDTEGNWQEKFNLLVTDVMMRFPKAFADSAITGVEAGWISFVEAAPEEAKASVSKLPGAEIREYSSYSLAEYEAASRDLNDIASKHLGEGSSVVTYRDGEDYTLTVLFTLPSGGQPEIDRATSDLAELFRKNVRLPAGFDVQIKYSSEEIAASELLDGGRVTNGCTMSFPVKKGIDLGILTAAHCSGTGTYSGYSNPFFAPQAYSQYATDLDPGGDFRWRWSAYGLTGKTYVGLTDTRTINGSAFASLNTNICTYGASTGYKCSTVARSGVYYTVFVADAGANFRVGPLRGTEAHITAGGDSGGPWFYGSVGYGVHSGVAGGSVFSSLPNALARLNVVLVTP